METKVILRNQQRDQNNARPKTAPPLRLEENISEKALKFQEPQNCAQSFNKTEEMFLEILKFPSLPYLQWFRSVGSRKPNALSWVPLSPKM